MNCRGRFIELDRYTWRVGEWKNERGRENGEWERPVMYENVK